VIYFKERLSTKSWLAAGLCLLGTIFITWNGLPLSVLLESNHLATILYLLSGIFAGMFVVCQKKLSDSLEPAKANFTMFFWCSILTAIPVPFNFGYKGTFNLWSVLSLVCLGFITGASFYLYGIALKKVSFAFAVIIVNSCSLFTLLSSWLLFNEPITIYVISGTILFLFGIIILNIPQGISLRRLLWLKPINHEYK